MVLPPLQFQAAEISLRDSAGLVPRPAYIEYVVVVFQVVLCPRQDRLGLQGLHKGAAQVEKQDPIQISVSRDRDSGCLLCTLPAQFALVLALMQIAEAAYQH